MKLFVRQCVLVLAAFMTIGICAADSALAAKRLALIVGNSKYPNWPLVNPINDARAIAKKLTDLNFDVTTKFELKRDDIGLVTEAFLKKVSPDDIVVFFYAGHGVQVAGQNFLLATDARIRTQYDVHRNGIDFSRFLQRLDATRASVKLVFLDACRNNPFAEKIRGGNTRGLARVGGAPFGTIISFATQPGGVAADGSGDHGLYTSALLEHIDEPGLPVEQMLKRVAASTHQASGGKQRPWVEGSLYGDFHFKEPLSAQKLVKPAVEKPADYSALAWKIANESNNLDGYEVFLQEFPTSPYARLARMKIAILGARVNKADQKRAEQAQIEQARVERAKAAQEKAAQAKAAKEQAAQAKAARAKAAQKKGAQEKAALAKAAQQKAAREKTARAQLKLAQAEQAQEATKLAALTKPKTDESAVVDASLSKSKPEQLNGRTIRSVSNNQFELELTFVDDQLVVNTMIWHNRPKDAVGYDKDLMRCGVFRNSISVSENGEVTGNCGAQDAFVVVSGRIDQIELNMTYLAPGGRTTGGRSLVKMRLED